MSPHGTPNNPLHELSMTRSNVPCARCSGVMMYSTRRSPPHPPVIPCRGVPEVVYTKASHPGSNSTGEIIMLIWRCRRYLGVGRVCTLDALIFAPVRGNRECYFEPVVCLRNECMRRDDGFVVIKHVYPYDGEQNGQ